MPDVYSNITEAERELQERLADIIELRFSDPRQQSMLHDYLTCIEFPHNAHVLEIGCGTGAVSRTVAQWPNVGDVTGIDLSNVFIERARQLAKNISTVSFEVGDGRSLSFAEANFDAVILHTSLCHIPQPERVLGEVYRVLRKDGWIAVFDGDYATATVAFEDSDPLQICVEAFRENFVNDPWLVRRLPRMLESAGFCIQPMKSHGYLESLEAGYFLTWIDRGADVLVKTGRIEPQQGESFKNEARRRSSMKEWFAFIAFASILGKKLR
jgi:ubiquinone/menaquinone biosynthesis C-methylase UbiE